MKYKDQSDYQSEIGRFIRQDLYLRFKKDGKVGYINPAFNEVYFSSLNGINIEGYFSEIADVYYIDRTFYEKNAFVDKNSNTSKLSRQKFTTMKQISLNM